MGYSHWLAEWLFDTGHGLQAGEPAPATCSDTFSAEKSSTAALEVRVSW